MRVKLSDCEWTDEFGAEVAEVAKALNPSLEERVARLEASHDAVAQVVYADIKDVCAGDTQTPARGSETVFLTPFGRVVRRGGEWCQVPGGSTGRRVVTL